MATKFSQKAAGIHFDLPPVESAGEAADADLPRQRPRTAIGTHVDALYRDRELADERDRLRAQLDQFDGARATKHLDPQHIALSRFANRHPDSYRDAEFVALREEIRAAGGNTQPIGVRPLPGVAGRYELSFGSRRRQACLELGIPVLAMIEEMDEVTLFERMERENRNRKNLRPYEQGTFYLKALDEKLFPSVRKMAEHLQIDPTGLGRLLAIARLPQAVVEAFASPLDIQFDWGAVLNEALQRNPDAVLARARQLVADGAQRTARNVLEQLVAAADAGDAVLAPSEAAAVQIAGAGKQHARVSYRGQLARVRISHLPHDKRALLEESIRRLLA